MKRELDTEYSKFWYTLMPFYLDKRKELIEKVVPLIVSADKDIPKIIYQLNDTMTKQRRFIRLDPDFINSYIEYYCNNLSTHITGGSGIFSKVFEANLINSISKYASEKLSTDKIILILSKIAYHIHFTKIYPISEDEIFKVIGSYNNKYGTKVSFKNFIEIVTNAKILIDFNKENIYYFSNQTYLAYFVASEINRQFINTCDTSQLNSILKLACFGINADIILFISLITDNIKILRLILSMANEYTKSWQEFDFINNVPNYLKQEFTYQLNEPPADIKKREEEERTRIEKESSFEIKKNNIYDYDEKDSDSIMNQIIRALQLLYIVSRCLPSFEHAMLKSDKDDFVDAIYKLPNKIFNLWITDTQNKIDEIMSFLKINLMIII